MDRVFVLAFKNATDRTSHTKYNEPTAQISYDVKINGINFYERTYANIRKIKNGQEMILPLVSCQIISISKNIG